VGGHPRHADAVGRPMSSTRGRCSTAALGCDRKVEYKDDYEDEDDVGSPSLLILSYSSTYSSSSWNASAGQEAHSRRRQEEELIGLERAEVGLISHTDTTSCRLTGSPTGS
jgi:hypothetical protein